MLVLLQSRKILGYFLAVAKRLDLEPSGLLLSISYVQYVHANVTKPLECDPFQEKNGVKWVKNTIIVKKPFSIRDNGFYQLKILFTITFSTFYVIHIFALLRIITELFENI